MDTETIRVAVNIGEEGDSTVVKISFHGTEDAKTMRNIRYKFSKEIDAPTIQDFVLHGLVQRMSKYGGKWFLEGTYTHEAVVNAHAYIEAWSDLRPDLYGKGQIAFQEIVDRHDRKSNAIVAFSGGIDSFFSLLRHKFTLKKAGHQLTEAMFVMGFDYNHNEKDAAAYQMLFERYATYLAKYDITLRSISSNIKGASMQNWSFGHAAQLASCMHIFHNLAGFGLIGSTAPYSSSVVWGSNPATDYLLSGGLMRVEHDGAAYSRTDKIGQILTMPEMVPLLKFCWQGDNPNLNCGKCLKCLKTRAAFYAHTGETEFPCFDTPFDESIFTDTFKIGGDLHFTDFGKAVKVARENGHNAKFIGQLEKALVRHLPAKKYNLLAREGLA